MAAGQLHAFIRHLRSMMRAEHGEVQMNLASNGGVELMLPSPRWPDSVDMKGRAQALA